MAAIHRSVASLRIIGDDLIPEEVTRLLGATPMLGHRKNELIRHPTRGTERVAKFGLWSRTASDQSPEDIDLQVEEIFSGLTTDLEVWRELTSKFRVDVFCGLFMREANEGFSLKPNTLRALGLRGVEIGFDLYGPTMME